MACQCHKLEASCEMGSVQCTLRGVSSKSFISYIRLRCGRVDISYLSYVCSNMLGFYVYGQVDHVSVRRGVQKRRSH